MYHAAVRAQLTRAFAEINRGNYAAVVAQFRPKHAHTFHGTHALAGTRTTLADTELWYARLARIFPDLKFDIAAIAVRGWPWNTTALVAWTDRFTVDGAPESNQGVHVLTIKWGRVARLAIHCDTQKLADVLTRKSAAGLPEATAPPIVTT